jgi:hypothetical protein
MVGAPCKITVTSKPVSATDWAGAFKSAAVKDAKGCKLAANSA